MKKLWIRFCLMFLSITSLLVGEVKTVKKVRLLHIDSSIKNEEQSSSRKLSKKLVETLKTKNVAIEVDYLDLVKEKITHIDGSFFTLKPEDNKYLQQFLKADIIVVSAPMYNFTIPSQLKSWFDHIVIAGQTFKYGDKGSEGLTKGKKVFVVSTRGGAYSGDAKVMEHQESYLRVIFGFIGIDDISVIRAENLGSPDKCADSIQTAIKEIENLKNIGSGEL